MVKPRERITMSRAFLEGMARIFDPFSNLDSGPYSGSRKKTDAEMLQSDWARIGQDMQRVLDSMGQQEEKKTVR